MDTHELLDSNYGEEKTGLPMELTSVSRYILFDVLSFGLYSVWYMYHIWDFFKKKDSMDIIPIARAIFGIFFFYSMCEKIKRFAKSKKYDIDYSSEGLIGGFIVFALLTRLPDPFWMVSVLSFLVYIQPIQAFNFAITNSSEYDGEIRTGYSAVQIILMIFGAIFWTLIFIGILMPDSDISTYE